MRQRGEHEQVTILVLSICHNFPGASRLKFISLCCHRRSKLKRKLQEWLKQRRESFIERKDSSHVAKSNDSASRLLDCMKVLFRTVFCCYPSPGLESGDNPRRTGS